MQTTELKVTGMSCGACVGHVTRALQSVDGVHEVKVDLEPGQAVVQHEGADVQAMIAAVEEEGFAAQAA
jgi:copper chaperone CopZ